MAAEKSLIERHHLLPLQRWQHAARLFQQRHAQAGQRADVEVRRRQDLHGGYLGSGGGGRIASAASRDSAAMRFTSSALLHFICRNRLAVAVS
jgi:hypothetical protein